MGPTQRREETRFVQDVYDRLRRRVCLRKGCDDVFQPRRWNQRYCQDPGCLRLVRRWQAAKRQRRRRQSEEQRQRHRDAERERRKRRREEAADESHNNSKRSDDKQRPAWSRSKHSLAPFCDRPGCYAPLRPSSRAKARYCGDDCRQAMRRVLDRERKWLRRNTYAGHFKRRMEYQQERARRSAQPETRNNPASGIAIGGDPTGRQLFGFL